MSGCAWGRTRHLRVYDVLLGRFRPTLVFPCALTVKCPSTLWMKCLSALIARCRVSISSAAAAPPAMPARTPPFRVPPAAPASPANFLLLWVPLTSPPAQAVMPGSTKQRPGPQRATTVRPANFLLMWVPLTSPIAQAALPASTRRRELRSVPTARQGSTSRLQVLKVCACEGEREGDAHTSILIHVYICYIKRYNMMMSERVKMSKLAQSCV